MSDVVRFPVSERVTLSEAYAHAAALCPGACPIEAGFIGFLADNECQHGHLPTDRKIACDCWGARAGEQARRVAA